jgi:23S rRNA (pseudouridine1915-N3)-methyltransferase
MKIKILAAGKNKDKNLLALQNEYFKRCRGWQIELIETDKPLSKISINAFVIVLDERGRDLKTKELSAELVKAAANAKEIIFVIGSPDGHDDEVRVRAKMLLAFGKLTWAHMLVRVMLAEQIYRIWSLHNHHPYHRE